MVSKFKLPLVGCFAKNRTIFRLSQGRPDNCRISALLLKDPRSPECCSKLRRQGKQICSRREGEGYRGSAICLAR